MKKHIKVEHEVLIKRICKRKKKFIPKGQLSINFPISIETYSQMLSKCFFFFGYVPLVTSMKAKNTWKQPNFQNIQKSKQIMEKVGLNLNIKYENKNKNMRYEIYIKTWRLNETNKGYNKKSNFKIMLNKMKIMGVIHFIHTSLGTELKEVPICSWYKEHFKIINK
jgi:hypothetical protein